MLKEMNYTEPERVCTTCIRRHSKSDYSKDRTVFEAESPKELKVLLFAAEMQTRKTLEYLARELTGAGYSTITFDLPGLGARDRETLTEASLIKTIADAVDKYALNGVPVILFGISMSAYGILKSLGSFKHRKVFGVVLMNAAKNYYQVNSLLLKGKGEPPGLCLCARNFFLVFLLF